MSAEQEENRTSTQQRGVARIVNQADLPHSEISFECEGQHFGATNISDIVIDAPPGTGPKLHKHPYEEVFVVQEGSVTFTVGDDVIEATGGQILVVPAGVPHKFVSSGSGRLRQIDIHASRRFITDWLDG